MSASVVVHRCAPRSGFVVRHSHLAWPPGADPTLNARQVHAFKVREAHFTDSPKTYAPPASSRSMATSGRAVSPLERRTATPRPSAGHAYTTRPIFDRITHMSPTRGRRRPRPTGRTGLYRRKAGTGGERPRHAVGSELPKVEGVDLGEVARRYDAALPRVAFAMPEWKELIAHVVVYAIMLIAGSLMAQNVVDIARQSQLSATVTVATVYAAILTGVGVFLYATARQWVTDLRVIKLENQGTSLAVMRGMLALLTVSPVVSTLSAAFTHLHSEASLPVWVRAASQSNIWVGVAGISLFLVRARRAFDGMNRETEALHPLDRVAVHLVTIAAFVQRCAENTEKVDFRDVRVLLGALERLAADAERFALPRVPWWDHATRRDARLDGLRLAAVIRAHKAPLVRAVSAEDYAKVARSLTGGLGAWSRDDFAAMVRDAPEVAVPSGLRPLIARLWPAVLVASLGIVLPLLPPLSEAAQAAAAARTSLLVAAVLLLVRGVAPVQDYIKTIVEKTVLPK